MGFIINVVGINHGIELTKTGWKNFDFTKHNRDFYWGNKCCVCGEKCYQTLGREYEQICIECSPKWIKSSIEELDKIKARLEEQQKNLIENSEKMMKVEKNKIYKWAKEDILDKLESEQ